MALYKPNEQYNAKARQILNGVRTAANAFSIASGEGPLVVTEEWRSPRPGHPSFHPKHQAEDWRCNDKPARWIAAIARIIEGFKFCDVRLQYDLHREMAGTPEHHIHVEYDEGEPI